MGDVLRPMFMTTKDVPVERVISGARVAALETVIVIGEEPNGSFYFAASSSDAPSILWLLERARHELIEQARRL